MHPFFKGHNFYAFVHRGVDEEKTENTLEAFQYSSDLGFVFMETDVQSTSDGKVVISVSYTHLTLPTKRIV